MNHENWIYRSWQYGAPYCRQLARAGHEMIVFDLSREAVDGFVEEFDVRPANGLESLAQAADIIITIVPSLSLIHI